MSEGTGLTVECEVCGTAFDPTAAGGWCTNPECGEWKYDGDAIPDPPDETGTREIDDPVADDGNSEVTSSGIVDPEPEYSEVTVESDQMDAVSNTESEPSGETSDAVAAESEPATGSPEDRGTASDGVETERDGVETEAEDADEPVAEDNEADETSRGADETGETADETDETVETVEGTDDADAAVAEADGASEAAETPEPEDSDAGSESEDETGDAEIICPGCAEQLDAATNFCPNCGEDVSAVEPDSKELTACPACGDDVDAGDSFCASCGENLDEHRGQTALTECPDCGAAVDDDDSFCADCGENLDDHRDPGAGDASEADGADPDATESADGAPESLLLTTRDREIAVTDGETVGRKLREILTETGGDENDAVRIHREHVRFVREDGQFYLVDLGENPTEVNGSSLAKGDRKRISPGDEITLSDVATLTVAHP